MKQKFLYRSFFISLLLAILHACTDETNVIEEQAIRLTVSVTDGGYLSAAGKAPATRAKEDEYRTKFTAGDKIGLYAVRNSKIVEPYNNLCLTYDGTAWKFPSDDATTTYWYEGAVYYAYYPYNSSQAGINASATDVDGFFASIVSGWTPDTDQSTYEKYTAQDLMTGVGKVGSSQADGTRPLSIILTHRMGLVELRLPYKKYTLSTDNAYVWVFDFPKTELKFTPYRMSIGNYRYIVKPGTDYTLSGSYTNATNATATWSFSANATAGNCNSYKIDGAKVTEITHTLQIGDYYCRDNEGKGYFVSKGANTEELSTHQCVGVVFYVGKNNNDNSNYPSNLFAGNGSVHGYAVAMTNSTEPTENYGKLKWDSRSSPTTIGTSSGSWDGYNNQTILNRNLSILPAAKSCTTYGTASGYGGTKWAAPSNSSGWYLPATGQLVSIHGNKTTINGSIRKGNGLIMDNKYYWASNEASKTEAYVLLFNTTSTGNVVQTNKTENNCPRPVCTF